MSSEDQTIELIPINILEDILFKEDVYYDFIYKSGSFKDEELEKYVEPLNNYLTLYSKKAVGMDEEVFNRINKINSLFGGDKRFEYLAYLLNTQPIVTIKDINDILYDDTTYEKFLKFYDNPASFPHDLFYYLNALDYYFDYLRKTRIAIDEKAIARFNNIRLVHALDYKRIVVLKGEPASLNLAPELEKEILDSVDLTRSKFAIARDLYIELNKRCTYDVDFSALDQDLGNAKAKKIYDGFVKKKKNRYSVVCNTWAIIYAHLLTTCGINAKVTHDGNGIHSYVEFDCDGTHMRADATKVMLGPDGLNLDDLTRCQLGLPTVGFVCLDENKDISYIIEETDKELEYYHENKISLTATLASEYKEKYMLNKGISVIDKVNFLERVANKSQLSNFELIKYLMLVYDTIFTDEDKTIVSRKYIAFSMSQAGVILSYKNENEDEYKFIVFGKKYIKKCNARQLNRMLDKNKITVVGRDKKIYGLERNEANENDRGIKK